MPVFCFGQHARRRLYVKQKTSCFSFRQTRNLAMGSLTRSVLADVVVSTRDKDITVGAEGEVVPKIEHRIIRVIKKEKPLLAFSRQTSEGIVLRVPCSFGYGNTSEVCSDRFNRAGVNEKYFRKPLINQNEKCQSQEYEFVEHKRRTDWSQRRPDILQQI